MASLTSDLALTLTFGLGLAILSSSLFRKESGSLGFPALLASITFLAAGTLGLVTSPVAWSVPQDTGQPAPEQELQATTSAGKYIGLEYVQGVSSENAKGDQEIINTIKDMDDSLVVQSSNGSVFLSGTVNNRQTARSLVDSTKKIPGVIQVSYELGLEQG
jgi:hypothetical protein